MLTEIEAYEWAIYFRMRAEEMKKTANAPTDPFMKSKRYLFVFR